MCTCVRSVRPRAARVCVSAIVRVRARACV